MKSVAFVPIVLITCSASPTRKGGRKWHRKPENLEDAKKLRRRFMKITDVKDVGLLAKGGGYYDKKEEAYDPAAYDVTAAASYEDKRRLAVNTGMSGSCPLDDVVTCVDGNATYVGVNATVGTPTCQEACDGGCCLGNGTAVEFSPNPAGTPINSCTGFNGKVCKSGNIPSCSDNRTEGNGLGRACYNANITEVVNGCNGRGACQKAGYNGGIGRVVNGCHGGDFSCRFAAYNGSIGEIVDSCIGKEACIQATAFGGNIGYINHGCRGVKACLRAAYAFGNIGGISYACNNISACYDLANGFEGYGYYGYNSIDSAVVSCCNEASECTGDIINKYGLPDQCGTSSPTSSPTTAEPTVGPTSSPITVSPTTVSPVTSLPTDSPVSSTSSPTVDGLSGKSGKSLSKSSTSSPTVDGLSAKSGKSLSKTETLSPTATGLSKSGKGGRPLFTKAIKGAVDSIQDEQQISMIQDEQQISLDLDDAHVVQILQDLITTGRLKKEMELGDVIAELGGDDTHYEFV